MSASKPQDPNPLVSAFAVRPAPIAWRRVWGTALTTSLCYLLGLLTGHLQWGAWAFFGGFASFYVAGQPYRRRARVLGAVVPALAAAMLLGGVSRVWWVTGPVLGAVSAAATYLTGRCRIPLPAGLMFILVACLSAAEPPGHLAARVLFVGVGGVIAWLVGMSGWPLLPRAPEAAAVRDAYRTVAGSFGPGADGCMPHHAIDAVAMAVDATAGGSRRGGDGGRRLRALAHGAEEILLAGVGLIAETGAPLPEAARRSVAATGDLAWAAKVRPLGAAAGHGPSGQVGADHKPADPVSASHDPAGQAAAGHDPAGPAGTDHAPADPVSADHKPAGQAAAGHDPAGPAGTDHQSADPVSAGHDPAWQAAAALGPLARTPAGKRFVEVMAKAAQAASQQRPPESLPVPAPAPDIPASVLGPSPLLPFSTLRIGIAVAGSVAVAGLLGLSHLYWVPLTCATVLQGETVLVLTRRAVQRVAGTVAGLLLAGALLAGLHVRPDVALAVVVVLQALMLTVIAKNYAIAVAFVTAFAFMILSVISPAPAWPLVLARLRDTLLGVAVALAATYLLWPRVSSRRLPAALAALIARGGDVLAELMAGAPGAAARQAPLVTAIRRAEAVAQDARAEVPPLRSVEALMPGVRAAERLGYLLLAAEAGGVRLHGEDGAVGRARAITDAAARQASAGHPPESDLPVPDTWPPVARELRALTRV